MITANGWATKDELDNFEASANDPAISGDDARHAKTMKNQKRKAISTADGTTLIARILQGWATTILQDQS